MHLSKKGFNPDLGEVFVISGNQQWRDLVASLIDRAILDLQHEEKSLMRKAFAWLHSSSIEKWSYHWCLCQLDLTPESGVKLIKLGLSGEYGKN